MQEIFLIISRWKRALLTAHRGSLSTIFYCIVGDNVGYYIIHPVFTHFSPSIIATNTEASWKFSHNKPDETVAEANLFRRHTLEKWNLGSDYETKGCFLCLRHILLGVTCFKVIHNLSAITVVNNLLTNVDNLLKIAMRNTLESWAMVDTNNNNL
jgi:hypothetical protein